MYDDCKFIHKDFQATSQLDIMLSRHVSTQACLPSNVSMNGTMRPNFSFSTVKIFGNIFPNEHLKTVRDFCTLLSTYARD